MSFISVQKKEKHVYCSCFSPFISKAFLLKNNVTNITPYSTSCCRFVYAKRPLFLQFSSRKLSELNPGGSVSCYTKMFPILYTPVTHDCLTGMQLS